MKKIVVISVIAVGVMGCSILNKKLGLKDDNVIEESAELILEAKTGIDVDFTPESPE